MSLNYVGHALKAAHRLRYMSSLEKASVEDDIEPFVKFIVSLITK